MRTKIVKATVLGLLLLCMCLSADIVYGMGGGGHRGDGRWDSHQPAVPYNSTSSCSDTPDAQEPLRVPEPIAALLLGLGVIGLASMRRRFNK